MKKRTFKEHVTIDEYDVFMKSTQEGTSVVNISSPSASCRHWKIVSRNVESSSKKSTSAATSTFLHAVADDFNTIENHLSISNTSDEVRLLI